MEWKIISKYYLPALMGFLIYFSTVLGTGHVFDEKGELYKGKLIFHCVILLLAFVGATIGASIEIESIRKDKLLPEEKLALTPKIDIKLFPSPTVAVTKYKYPLKEYVLMIQNLNVHSVPIHDFRIEFNFNNMINEIRPFPLLDTGGDVSVEGLRVQSQKKNGSISSYEEQPIKTPITKNFSLEIQQVKINGKECSTNIAIFTCERWPEKAGFSANIVVDLSKKPLIQKKPDEMGKYVGEFFYEIKGKKLSEKIGGTI